MTEARLRRELSREECLRLIGEVPVGRVVFTQRALPAVRVVSHLVEADQIVFRLEPAPGPQAIPGSGARPPVRAAGSSRVAGTRPAAWR